MAHRIHALTDEAIREALQAHHGSLTEAAKALQVGRNSLSDRVARVPALEQLVERRGVYAVTDPPTAPPPKAPPPKKPRTPYVERLRRLPLKREYRRASMRLPTRPPEPSNLEIMAAIQATRGLLHHTAVQLGISRSMVVYRIEKHAELQRCLQDVREGRLDESEHQLFQAISRGEPWAVKLHLETVGASRGYVKRTEVTGKDGESLIPANGGLVGLLKACEDAGIFRDEDLAEDATSP